MPVNDKTLVPSHIVIQSVSGQRPQRWMKVPTQTACATLTHPTRGKSRRVLQNMNVGNL
ncbi:hypothetical protein Mapa_013750 [Marchantia paleacea]|nr:hypothetical protein Mapa_013750 [Marchantia paleacea]